MLWLLLCVSQCALAQEADPKESPVSWTTRVECSEAHEIVDTTYKTLAARRSLSLSGSIEWTRSSAGGPSVVGVLREGSLAFEEMPVSDPRMLRPTVKGDVPADGIKVTVDLGKKGVRVALSRPELGKALVRWRLAARGWRITSKQYPGIEGKLTAFLKEMLEIAASISVADADQSLENMVISRPLYSDEGKKTGIISFQTQILWADVSPDGPALRAPLKIQRMRNGQERQWNIIKEASLVLGGREGGVCRQWLRLDGFMTYLEDEDPSVPIIMRPPGP